MARTKQRNKKKKAKRKGRQRVRNTSRPDIRPSLTSRGMITRRTPFADELVTRIGEDEDDEEEPDEEERATDEDEESEEDDAEDRADEDEEEAEGETSAEIDEDDPDAERSVTVSFSSQTPVREFDADVILLHEEGAVDMRRLRDVGGVLLNHNPDNIIGSITQIGIDPSSRRGVATFRFDDTEAGELAISRVRSGSLRGVSVGFRAENDFFLDEGEEWTSPEGQRFVGPAVVVDQWTPLEFSLTPIPADPAVGVNRSISTTEEGLKVPPKLRKRLESHGLPRNATDQEALDYLAAHPEAAEPVRERSEHTDDDNDGSEMSSAQELAVVARESGLSDRLADWIERDISPEQASREALRHYRSENARPSGSGRVVVSGPSALEKFHRVAQVGMARSVGLRVSDEEAREVRGAPEFITLRGMLVEVMRLQGLRNAHLHTTQQLLSHRSFNHSTTDFALILGDLINRSLRAGFEETPVTYPIWTGSRTVNDFRPQHEIDFSEATDFEEVLELAPITETTHQEESISYTITTYGKKFSISRNALINDDLNAFTRIPGIWGAAASRTQERAVYAYLNSGAGNNGPLVGDGLQLFDAGHASGTNVIGASAPDATVLGNMRKQMRLQKGTGGSAILNITPKYILSPANYELAFEQLLNGTWMPDNPTPALTPDQRSLQLVVSPYLDEHSATKWYVHSAETRAESVIVARLAGQSGQPILDQQQGHDILGTSWVGYYDFGLGCASHRGIQRNG